VTFLGTCLYNLRKSSPHTLKPWRFRRIPPKRRYPPTRLDYHDSENSLSMALQPFGPWPHFQFLNLYTFARTLWMSDQPVARPLPTHTTTQTQNTRTETSMPPLGLEPTIAVFQRAKTVHALVRSRGLCDRQLRKLLKTYGSTVFALPIHFGKTKGTNGINNNKQTNKINPNG
jgi:hypothetical protein